MKPFAGIAVAIFAIVAIIHLLRFLAGWEIVVSGFIIPTWWSVPAFVATAALALMLGREARG